jgi:hypothetical protein
MRSLANAFRNRRILAGIALAALAGGLILLWSRASLDEEANARGFEPAISNKPGGTPATRVDAPRADEASRAPQGGFARFQDYFDRSLYASYSYASPPQTATSPISAAAPSATSPASAFTLPSVSEMIDTAKLLSKPWLSLATSATSADPPTAASASVSVSASASPTGLLTNNTPFHLFVTSDPVSAVAASSSGAPSVASSAGGGTGGVSGAAGAAISTTTGSLTSTAGSLLRK